MVEKWYLCSLILNKSIKVIWSIFALAFTVCEKLILKMFDLENVGQGHGGEKLHLCHSIANV